MSLPNNSDATSTNGSVNTAGTVPLSNFVDNPADASALRLSISNLRYGAAPQNQQLAGQVFNYEFKAANGTPIQTTDDWRVRISMQEPTAALFYNKNNPITSPLAATSGVIFPYTPTLTIQHNARYSPQPLTHTNYNSYFYEGSDISNISLTGEFTVQNISEGQYLMAVVHFFRSCTKMFYGRDPQAGTPPPMVFLDGYGPAYLPHVPCIVTQFSHTMPAEVDYIEVPIGIAYSKDITDPKSVVDLSNFSVRTRLPTTSSISLQLQPVYSRNNIANNFTLNNFAQGLLIKGSTAKSGGFI